MLHDWKKKCPTRSCLSFTSPVWACMGGGGGGAIRATDVSDSKSKDRTETLRSKHVGLYLSVWTAVVVEMLSKQLTRWPQGGPAGALSPADTSFSFQVNLLSSVGGVWGEDNKRSFSQNLSVALRWSAESRRTRRGRHPQSRVLHCQKQNVNPVWGQVRVAKMLNPNTVTVRVSQGDLVQILRTLNCSVSEDASSEHTLYHLRVSVFIFVEPVCVCVGCRDAGENVLQGKKK